MPNPNYQMGTRFEYLRKRTWENKGYIVIRASGSHGAFDLICIPRSNKGPCTLVQCKRTKDLATAKRLLRKFEADPPLPLGEHRQIMEVGVTGEREIRSVEVYD